MVANYSGETILCRDIRTGWQNGTGGNAISTTAPTAVTATATYTITPSTNLGRPLFLGTATGFTTTLPAATGTGNVYTIVVSVTASGGSYTISAAGSDKVWGNVIIGATASGNFVVNNNSSIAMNGTTTGGIKGSTLIFTDQGTNFWVVEANLVGSGTAANTGIS